MDSEVETANEEHVVPAAPARVKLAAITWIIFGGLALFLFAILWLVFGFALAFGVIFGSCLPPFAVFFVVIGVMTLRGKAYDTLGNGVGSVAFGVIVIALALL